MHIKHPNTNPQLKQELTRSIDETVIAASKEQKTITDQDGRFSLRVPHEPLTLKIEGKYIATQEKLIGPDEPSQNLQMPIEFVIPPVHESLVITAVALDPSIDRRNDAIYKNTLFFA